MDFLDLEKPELAERRLARRLAREEARRRQRRKLTIVGATVGIAFAVALAFALLARPGAASDDARVASTPSPAPAASPATGTAEPEPAPDPEPAEVEPEPAPEPEPEPEPEPKPAPKPAAKPSVQKVSIGIGGAGYEPSTVKVAAGRPVRITVEQGEGCAAGFYMPELGVEKDNSSGPVTFQLDPLEPGSYVFTCGMGMVSGQLVAE